VRWTTNARSNTLTGCAAQADTLAMFINPVLRRPQLRNIDAHTADMMERYRTVVKKPALMQRWIDEGL
jgi:hypothetical protein